MYFQKNMKCILTIVLCLTLITGQFVASPITVCAATSDEITLTDDGILKYVLAKMGVFLNDSLLSKFGDSLGNVLYNDLCELTPAFKEWSDNWLTLNTDLEGKFKSASAMLGYILKHNAFTTPIEIIDDMVKVKKTDKLILPNTISNKIKERLDVFLEENTGYYLYKTRTVSNIDPAWFTNKTIYDNFCATVRSLGSNAVFISMHATQTGSLFDYATLLPFDYLVYDNHYKMDVYPHPYSWDTFFRYNKNWKRIGNTAYRFPDYTGSLINNSTSQFYFTKNSYNFSDLELFTWEGSLGECNFYNIGGAGIYSGDGHIVKLYKTIDSMQQYSVGYQPYYYTSNYANYDSSIDNSQTFTGSSYSSSTSTNYYEQIQNQVSNEYNTDNSITEGDVTNIVNNYYQTTIIQGGGSGGDDSGGSSGGDNSGGGGGIAAIIEGIGKLLNALATIIGKVVGLISDFLVTVLNILGNFTGFTDGFSEILKAIFYFLPPEFVDTMVLGLTVSILLCIIKFLKG